MSDEFDLTYNAVDLAVTGLTQTEILNGAEIVKRLLAAHGITAFEDSTDASLPRT